MMFRRFGEIWRFLLPPVVPVVSVAQSKPTFKSARPPGACDRGICGNCGISELAALAGPLH